MKTAKVMEYTNENVYDFLSEELKYHSDIKHYTSKQLQKHEGDADFWNTLSESLDCFRVCEVCQKPMIVGYCVDGSCLCSDECLHQVMTDDEYEEAYNEGEGDSYYTVWYEDSITFQKQKGE